MSKIITIEEAGDLVRLAHDMAQAEIENYGALSAYEADDSDANNARLNDAEIEYEEAAFEFEAAANRLGMSADQALELVKGFTA